MEKSTSKPIVFDPKQSQLGYVIVRSCGFTQSRLSTAHQELAAKMEKAARYGMAGLCSSQCFTSQEMKLMREYNTEYCYRLANSAENATGRHRDFQIIEALDTYRLATEIQLQFSALR